LRGVNPCGREQLLPSLSPRLRSWFRQRRRCTLTPRCQPSRAEPSSSKRKFLVCHILHADENNRKHAPTRLHSIKPTFLEASSIAPVSNELSWGSLAVYLLAGRRPMLASRSLPSHWLQSISTESKCSRWTRTLSSKKSPPHIYDFLPSILSAGESQGHSALKMLARLRHLYQPGLQRQLFSLLIH